jgi:L-malate glycosyltransferase
MYRVLIIQSEMKRYRSSLFLGLHAALQEDGVELKVAYSNTNKAHGLRNDRADLPQPLGQKVKSHWFFDRLVYQRLWTEVFRSDLVIVGPEVKYLINPALLLMSALRMKRVAFWGLGPNMHPTRSRIAEWVKKPFFTKVDWWFAYTKTIAEYLIKQGMPAEKITVVQNTTDTAELRALMQKVPDEEVSRTKESLTGERDSVIGLYCGLIGEIKDIPLLLDAARLVKKRHKQFHLVVIGDGPQRSWLEAAIAEEPWIHYLGSRYGLESALYYKMSDVFLLSGSAGLSVVDSFAAGLPLLATHLPMHPPEISYVVDGENGYLAPHETEAFAETILGVVSDAALMEKLRSGAREAGSRYTMEAMIANFRKGINNCLASDVAASRSGNAKPMLEPKFRGR